jgi:tRNA U34 5-methylaminomethyl-2-thiouridine-forming methyltransferase MnmC
VLSTYACTGHLKRALIAAGFKLEIREGYASKRDSTLAYRLESAQRNND